jgi:hypothetical protein
LDQSLSDRPYACVAQPIAVPQMTSMWTRYLPSGALEAAIAEYPGRNVTLRQRSRLLDGTMMRARRGR